MHILDRRFHILSVAVFGFFVACGGEENQGSTKVARVTTRYDAAEEVQAARGPKVLFLGDSIAAGLHLEARDAFPAVLERMLAEEGLPFQLINAGLSGDTTSGGLGRLAWTLRQKPDVLVIELGSNDGLRGIDLELIAANLDAIIEQARAAGAEVLLLGGRLPTNYGGEYTSGFAELFQTLADELDVAFVPFFLEGVGGDPELNLPDGLHPTPEGHRRIAETVAPALRGLVR